MFVLLWIGCAVDNTLNPKNTHDEGFDSGDTVDPPFTAPELQVDPAAVGLGIVCGEGSEQVTLSNVGDGPLTIRALEIEGEGWTVSPVALPLLLAPGESSTVEVRGVGSASLLVRSDDPGSGTLRVPLDARADVAPSLAILSPGASATLPSGVSGFEARVVDDLDPPEALALRWISDVDGVVGADPARPDGLATLEWRSEARTPGPHQVVLEAVDSCGNLATTELPVCQQAGYVADSLDLSTWHFEGSSRYDATNGWVELTTPTYNQAGTAFQTGGIVSADNVNVSFAFFVSGGSGADGISVTALDVARMTGFVGSTGGGIGYLGMPGWSVEVDTWYNGENNDPTTEDHISVHVDGNLTEVLAWAALPEMEDGAWHTMDLSVVGVHVTARIDGVTYIDQDVPQIRPFNAYVGFTAATGGSTNYHLIDALEVTEYVCPE